MVEFIKILSWNYHHYSNDFKKRALMDMVIENNIDIIVLQEARGFEVEALLSATHSELEYPNSGVSNGVRVFLRNNYFEYENVDKGYYNKWIFVKVKKLTGSEWFNICAVHLYSKRDRSERMQMWDSLKIINAVKDYEKAQENKKTILIGDFNHNPYETNMLDPIFLNAKNSRSYINLTEIELQESKKNNTWYNPMWNFLGDYDFTNQGERITGTYYWNKNEDEPSWNLYDGVLLRPLLMNRIDFKKSKILTHTKQDKFIKDQKVGDYESVIATDFSDHLPIVITLKLN